MSTRRFPLWIFLGVVLIGALVIGSGVFTTTPVTPAQRALAIETGIKCPSCEDLSVANSSAQTAVVVRTTVRQLIAEGKSDQEIQDYLVARYGAGIVLVPPARGWSLLVWVLPLGGGAAAAATLTTVLTRKRREAFVDPAEVVRTDAKADVGAGSGQHGARRQFLQQSLADAFVEHQAGDLSDSDYRALSRRDTARLAALDSEMVETTNAVALAPDVTEAVAQLPVTTLSPMPRPKRNRRQRLLVGGAVGAFGSALILVVALFAANRLPGQTPSGNATLSQQAQIQQTLAQAATLVDEGQSGEAAQLYQKLLDENSKNEVALAQLGWLEYQTGVQGKSPSLIEDGRLKLNRAVQLSPGDYAARLYLGTLLLNQDNNASGAVAQYQVFLAGNPPAMLLHQAASIVRKAYLEAGIPLASGVPAS